MEADFKSLGRIVTKGPTVGSNASSYNWDFVKESAGITLLSSRHPKGGLCYKIVEQHTTAYEKQVYPTASNPAKDGNAEVERNSAWAYQQFQVMVSTGVGTSSSQTGVIPALAVSFKDLDAKLTSLPQFDKKLVIELQRTGINDFGGMKTTLDLRYVTNAIMWNKERELSAAAIYYRSYERDRRINALKDMRESILMEYMEPSVMAQIIRANRQLRKEYQMSEYEGSLNDFSSNQGSPLLPDTTYASFSVKFIDQLGEEIPSLPYIASVRGAINYRESWLKTNGGKSPADFASGATLFENSEDQAAGRHYLYRYKVNEDVPHRGTYKVQIILPDLDSESPWANNRLKVYGGTPDSANDREGSIIAGESGIVLTSQAFSFMGAGSHVEVRVPVYREPIPTHLVDAGGGRLVSKWSTVADVNRLPAHQKVKLRMRVSRLKQSLLWEKADKNADGSITQDEYQSPEGEAARNDLNFESKIPVRGVSLELRPSSENIWLAARSTLTGTTDLSGTVSITAPVGEYAVVMVSQDGTGSPMENQIGRIEIPAGVYFRDTSPHDTTPIGIVGATMIESTSTVVDYQLKSPIPPLPRDKSAEYGTVYAIKSLPGVETGWPNNAGTGTSDTIFDEFEVILPPLPGEVALSKDYEDLDEQETDSPPIEFGQSIELTQESTGAVVSGIDPTDAGTKWTVTRMAFKKNSTPSVSFSNQYNPLELTDQFGNTNYATANIMFPRAVSMDDGEDVLVLYPQITGSIVAYPTESVVIGTPGTGQDYTMEIIDTEAPLPTAESTKPEVSNALPIPVVSNALPIPVVSNALPVPAVSNSNAITADYLSSQAIVNAYAAGNIDYSNATSQLQSEHGWSQTDVDNELSAVSSNRQAAIAAATAIAQNQTAEAARFQRAAQTPQSTAPALPTAVQEALARLSNPNWAPRPAPSTPAIYAAPPTARDEANRFARRFRL